ncbi:unnamed protein product [Phytophthora fragariaefolia]|uniref:Unnamed protein product n=1 Tax=Phytophthora fragariaefolia TaxID=1490495 RepID=A0A9W7D2W3_9STRA|nr:unnamed protein product [Phytophthora fragariaefolia]
MLLEDPVLQMMQLGQIGDLMGPVTAPLIAVKALMNLLKEAGLVAGAFGADELFDLGLDAIRSASLELFHKLKILVRESPPIADPTVSPQIRSYESAAEPGSDSSEEPRRMSLGPSGTAMLADRLRSTRKKAPRSDRVVRAQPMPDRTTTTAISSTDPTDRLESHFQAAMSRFLREQQVATVMPAPDTAPNLGSQDVEMESAGPPDRDPDLPGWEYYPDDMDLPEPDRAAVASATAGSGGSTMIQRVRFSAVSDLKKFMGKEHDEDRARQWIGKVKSAFLRDQATDAEKCLTFADLLSGPARNWYRQLARSTRKKWPDLLKSFQTQYCGFGVSVARQYYHARKRSDESPLEYLHRLNVAVLRARLKIKDGGSKERQEHVGRFIEALGDQELSDQLTLLRLPDAGELEEVLRALERAKTRQKKAAFESSKFRQKGPVSPAPAAPAKHVRSIQIQAADSGSDSGTDGSDGSDSDEGQIRRI